MKLNWIVTYAIIGTVIFGISIYYLTQLAPEFIDKQEQYEKTQKLKEMAKKGIVTYESNGSGKNIVDYRYNTGDHTFDIDPNLKETLRQKQRLLTRDIAKPLFSEDKINIPANLISINREHKALEIGIGPDSLTEENIPEYFDRIREIVGEQINVVLIPSFPAVPTHG